MSNLWREIPSGRIPTGSFVRRDGAGAAASIASEFFGTVGAPSALSPGAGALTLNGEQPSVSQPISLSPGSGAVTFIGEQSSVIQPTSLSPGAGAVTFTGATPVVAQPKTISPSSAAVVFTGAIPTFIGSLPIGPVSGSLSFTGAAPAIIQPSSHPQVLYPGDGRIVFGGGYWELPASRERKRPGRAKRAIPAPNTNQVTFNTAVKERLEVISGERLGSIDLLPESATQAQILAKINELLERLQ